MCKLRRAFLHPPLAALGEDGLEVAFEEGAGVLEVLFGVGFGGGDALKRFVEDADDPLLFGERGDDDWERREILDRDTIYRCTTDGLGVEKFAERRSEILIQEITGN